MSVNRLWSLAVGVAAPNCTPALAADFDGGINHGSVLCVCGQVALV